MIGMSALTTNCYSAWLYLPEKHRPLSIWQKKKLICVSKVEPNVTVGGTKPLAEFKGWPRQSIANATLITSCACSYPESTMLPYDPILRLVSVPAFLLY